MTRYDVYQAKPATASPGQRWRDCTPLGNGYTGVTLYGGAASDILAVSRADLWCGGNETSVPDVSHILGEMRALQREHREEEACNLMWEALNNEGYGTRLADMRTLGCVKLLFDCNGIYNHYRRTVHTDTSEVEISYRLGESCFKRYCFVSRKRDIIVVRIVSGSPCGFSLSQGFYDSFEGNGREKELREKDAEHAEYKIQDGCTVYSSDNEGKYFGLAARVISNGKTVTCENEICVSAATDSLLLIKAFSQAEDREAAISAAVKEINSAPLDYGVLFYENKKLYGTLYGKADIKLYHGRNFHSNEELLANAAQTECSVELAEKLWRYGRYLFISGVNRNGLPFPLYGLWPCGYSRDWSQHVANENVQIIHMHAAVGGLCELLPSLINFYCDKTEYFRENAKKLFGCEGIFVGAYLTPYNSLAAPHVPVILHFLGAAGWLCAHFYQYYRYTLDEKLFTDKILPFMRETAKFYRDYAYEDENGKIELYPAVSPENSPEEYKNSKYRTASGHSMPVTKNPTVEFAILKELLTNLTEVAKTHPELCAEAKQWKEMLSKLPDYRINESGAIAEWMDESVHDYYEHRHLSHIYPLFPGTEIADSGRADLIPAFKKAVDMRKLGFMTGWSLAHMSGVYARLGDGDKVFEALNMLTKVCLLDNFFTLHNDYRGMGITATDMGNEAFAPVQLDALMGAVNAVQEMLLFVSPKRIKLLPACSQKLSRGSARLCFCDGTVNMRWDMKKLYCRAKFIATSNTAFELELPFGKGKRQIELKSGESVVIEI